MFVLLIDTFISTLCLNLHIFKILAHLFTAAFCFYLFLHTSVGNRQAKVWLDQMSYLKDKCFVSQQTNWTLFGVLSEQFDPRSVWRSFHFQMWSLDPPVQAGAARVTCEVFAACFGHMTHLEPQGETWGLLVSQTRMWTSLSCFIKISQIIRNVWFNHDTNIN